MQGKNETILVVGFDGNMGRRYTAILKYLDVDTIGIDLRDKWPVPSQYTRAIVATPIDTHYKICKRLIQLKKDFLCEKPVSKSNNEIRDLIRLCKFNGVDGRMVCNWAMVLPRMTHGINENKIFIDYYNSGNDGFWDYIQPVYLSKLDDLIIRKISPVFKCKINYQSAKSECFDLSYVKIIRFWFTDRNQLWTLSDALAANIKLLQWAKKNHVK